MKRQELRVVTVSTKAEHKIAKATSPDGGEALGRSFESDEARYGRRVADLQHRVNGPARAATHRLGRPLIDHTQLDVVVIDENTGVHIGQPCLEIHICPVTRMIFGFKAIPEPLTNQEGEIV